MNIFVISNEPIRCAKMLDDKRVVKMILESAQLLSNAITYHGGIGPYRVSHKEHPCSIWARSTQGNYMWLFGLYVALLFEYTARFKKVHKCYELLPELADGHKLIPVDNRTPFVNCTPYKELDVFKAYRLTLRDKWKNDKRKPRWYKKEAQHA
jgi:hypothetical protein